MRRRKHWGWGHEDEQRSEAELRDAAAGLAAHLGFGSAEVEAPAPVRLPAPRVAPPPGLPVVADDHARAVHAHGASYGDVVRAFRGRFPHAPDGQRVRPGAQTQMPALHTSVVGGQERLHIPRRVGLLLVS